MDLATLADVAMGLLLAALTGAVGATTDLAKKLGKGTVEKVASIIKRRFTKDGEGAVHAFGRLEQQPNDAAAQKAVHRRLEGLLEDDPTFAAEIKGIIGEVKIDWSVHQYATAGNNSSIIQINGHDNTAGGKS